MNQVQLAATRFNCAKCEITSLLANTMANKKDAFNRNAEFLCRHCGDKVVLLPSTHEHPSAFYAASAREQTLTTNGRKSLKRSKSDTEADAPRVTADPIPIGNTPKEEGWPLVGWLKDHPAHTCMEVLDAFSIYVNVECIFGDDYMCCSCFGRVEGGEPKCFFCPDCNRVYCDDCTNDSDEKRCKCGTAFDQ